MSQAPVESEGAPLASEASPQVKLWPILITAGLVLVVIVNAVFIYIAVSGADDVVPSYTTEER